MERVGSVTYSLFLRSGCILLLYFVPEGLLSLLHQLFEFRVIPEAVLLCGRVHLILFDTEFVEQLIVALLLLVAHNLTFHFLGNLALFDSHGGLE